MHEASRGPLSSPRWRCLEFSSSVSRLLCAWPTRFRVYDDVELLAVQFSGLPGNDRPLTHTVTSHLARSLVLARWRHSISSEVKPLPSLPLAGVLRIRIACVGSGMRICSNSRANQLMAERVSAQITYNHCGAQLLIG